MTQQEVIDELVERTRRELQETPSGDARSRIWKDPEGYQFLVQWSNAVLLRALVRTLTASLPKKEYRRKAQIDDAARSVVRNTCPPSLRSGASRRVEEGFKRSTTNTYLKFVGYSQGSLEEVKGDIRELTDDGFLKSRPGSGLAKLGMDLGAFNRSLRGGYRKLKESKGNAVNSHSPLTSSNHPLKSSKASYRSLKESRGSYKTVYRPLPEIYPPLKRFRVADLTYEVFLELINKTDYVLRQLVVSLEKKLAADKKHYQVEHARILSKI